LATNIICATSNLHDLRITFSSIPTLNCTTAGFRIYDDSATKIYETTNTDSNEITCPDVEVTGTEATFTMTSFCEDGRESTHSAPFTVTFPAESSLNAVITANPSSGTAPLDVTFNGADSTGSITNYHWTFGDGSTAVDGVNVTHRFLSAADYTVTLTVTDNTGNTTSTHHTISVAGGAADNTPPTAVFSATTAVGDSPLSVTFDGSESSDADGDALTYSWNFGDGSSSDGSTPSATHIYTVAGTYQATLTVSDGTDQTTSSPIPVLVADGGPATGQPTASISVHRTSGPAPFLAQLDGSASTPSSGADSIVQYKWTFGDGSTASGKTVSHIFTDIGEYSVTLTVTDNTGTSNTATVKIDVQEKNDITKLLPPIYKLLLLNNRHQYTEKL
jgi:PKD repeat protein